MRKGNLYWPACTGVVGCDHRQWHETDEALTEYVKAHVNEFVNSDGQAICTCHSSAEATALHVKPFPCGRRP